MEAIQLIQVTPSELTEMIVNAVKTLLPVQKDDDVLLTPDQVSDMLNVELSTLQRWRKAGKITAYGAVGIVRYKKAEILHLLKPLK